MVARVIFFGLVTLAFASCFGIEPVVIEGTAMNPTLADGDRWLVTTPDALERGDIVVFRYPKDQSKRYVKRVVGLPGETIEIRNGLVFLNGGELVEEYVDQQYNESRASFPPKVIPPEHFYVIGDNRDNSSDSRYWGTVDRSLIEGKLYTRYISGETKK